MKKIRLKNETIRKIQLLRKKGASVPEIHKLTNIPKTTVFRHVKNIKILSEFSYEWSIKRGGSRKRKLEKEKVAGEEGKKLVANLTTKEKTLILAALYWGEGSKKDFGLSNTDPNLIKLFLQLLREVFKIEEFRFRASVRIYEDININESINYWVKVTNIPKNNFTNVEVLTGKKKGKLEYGMCRIRVLKGGDLLKSIKGINKAITESL